MRYLQVFNGLLLIVTLGFSSHLSAELIASNAQQPAYWQVQAGDIMWKIAGKVSPDESVTRFQVMVALLRANPQAFQYPCNMNSLKVGEKLHIPSKALIQTIIPKEASQAYSRQLKIWEDFRRKRIKINCPEPEPLPSITASTVLQPVAELTPTAITTPPDNAISPATPPVNISPYFDAKPIPNPPKPTPSASVTPGVATEPANTQPATESPVAAPSPVTDLPVDKQVNDKQPLAESPIPAPAAVTDLSLFFLISLVGIFILLLLSGVLLGWWLNRWLSKHKTSNTEVATALSPTVTPADLMQQQIEEKLRDVRTYLAEGESLIQVVLRDIIDKGTPQQQEEARHLYEINKKLTHLSEQPSKLLDHAAWDSVRAASQHLALRNYMSEDENRLFNLIDKIFELLDSELQADGKLIKAYQQRYSQAVLDTDEYEVVSKATDQQAGRRERAAGKVSRRL